MIVLILEIALLQDIQSVIKLINIQTLSINVIYNLSTILKIKEFSLEIYFLIVELLVRHCFLFR